MLSYNTAWANSMKALSSILLRFFCVLLFLQSSAFGDWQYTRWGMTADEIVVASNGKARHIRADEKEGESGGNFVAIALGTYSTGSFDFDVSFRASEGNQKLDTVSLKLRNPDDYGRLREALNAKYGIEQESTEPNSMVTSKSTIWRTAQDIITLTHVDALGRIMVYLNYSERPSDSGL